MWTERNYCSVQSDLVFAQLIGREATIGGIYCLRRSAKSRKGVVDVELRKRVNPAYGEPRARRHADYLVESLSAMSERDDVRGNPELVDLNRALIRAIRIRNFIRKRSGKRRVWLFVRSVLQDVLVLYEVARMIHSLLSNCTYISKRNVSICSTSSPAH